MRKQLFLLALIAVCLIPTFEAKAQFKIHNDGQVSLGSINTTYGLQVNPSCVTSFRSLLTTDYSWSTIVYSNNTLQKHWIVANAVTSTQMFYVYGNGNVYKAGSFRQADGRLQQESSPIENAGDALNQITGVRYTPVDDGDGSAKQQDRRIGVTAQEVEKIIPEAVSADENGMMYVDYEALTVFLIEAFKEQQAEIQTLRQVLEENHLIKP